MAATKAKRVWPRRPGVMPRDEYLGGAAAIVCKRGAALPQAKLSEEDVRAIRANAPGWSARRWAVALRVHYRTIEKVRQFASWTHIK